MIAMKRSSAAVLVCASVLVAGFGAVSAQEIIVDHTCTDITQIPESAINQAKATLHIGYGHTSHGSQLTTGMTGLVAFANGGGLGLSLPADIFAWNNGGTGGALDLEEGAGGWLELDCGYYPSWVDETREYLDDSGHSDVNVIIWSWCGQVDSKYAAGTLYSEYLTPMTVLEGEYPNVTFVYMTGHVDHWDDANNKAANQTVRDFCIANGKVLYDFTDIESYDPDGTYYEFPHDNCDYYESVGGALLGNWATEWQTSHTENVDWYDCTSAHSEPLNANRKAYAAWWLWARLAGWPGGDITVTSPNGGGSWTAGSTYDITWTTTGIVGDVDIAYSTDGGGGWTDIATGEANDGTYSWAIPGGIDSTQCRVRVQEADGDPTDMSDNDFTIKKASSDDDDGSCGGCAVGAGTSAAASFAAWASLAVACLLRRRKF